MDFEEYIKLTRETAIYPDSYERDYVIHGLVDEAGELRETVGSAPSRDDISTVKRSKFGGLHVQKVCAELGDVMWYTGRAMDHFGFDTSIFHSIDRDRFRPMNEETSKQKAQNILLAAARMNGHQKKSVRDDDDRRSNFKRNLHTIIEEAQKLAHHSGLFDIRVVMERNIEKLFDRKARDVLKGDGDNR